MHAVDFNTVFAVILAVVFGPWFAWFSIKALRKGSAGPKKLPADRAAHPVLFWTYVAMYGAGAAMFPAIAVFQVTYDPGVSAAANFAAMAVFAFCFGGILTSVASVTGFYAIRGFRTGTAAFIWQGSVDFYSRNERPGWYWATQIQNLAVVVLLGAMGLCGIGIALFFGLGPLLFG